MKILAKDKSASGAKTAALSSLLTAKLRPASNVNMFVNLSHTFILHQKHRSEINRLHLVRELHILIGKKRIKSFKESSYIVSDDKKSCKSLQLKL